MKVKINGRAFAVDQKAKDLLRATADNTSKSFTMRQALAQVVQRAWRAGVLENDTIDGIFDKIVLPRGADSRFPFDFYAPSDGSGENETFKAFVVPQEGAIPDRAVEGAEIYVPTYKIANSISWSLDYARDARWDVVARAIEVYTNGFTQKLNDDGWHVILTCGAENTPILDSAATAGVFSKLLLTGLQTGIKRLTGGRASRVTDLYLSPEGIADLRNFDADSNGGQIVDFDTLRMLLGHSGEAPLPSLFGVTIHELYELGAGQEYETFVVSDLSLAHSGGKLEYCIALDLSNRDSFVMPIREDMSMFDDPMLHRSARAGVYGWMEIGFGCLDSRRVLLGEF